MRAFLETETGGLLANETNMTEAHDSNIYCIARIVFLQRFWFNLFLKFGPRRVCFQKARDTRG